MVFVIEVLDAVFLKRFWAMIHDGEYEERQYEAGERKFFRFIKPQQEDFPKIIELFSRKPETITLPEGFHLTPIPVEEEISSLSAILLQENYYGFTLLNSSNVDGLILANEAALICLKAKAYLNNKQRKEEGYPVGSEDVEKHKKDVLKLTTTLTGMYTVSAVIKNDLEAYVQILQTDRPDISVLLRELGLAESSLDDLLEIIRLSFIIGN